MGAPSLRSFIALGWDTTNLNPPNVSSTSEVGAPCPDFRTWDSTNPNPPKAVRSVLAQGWDTTDQNPKAKRRISKEMRRSCLHRKLNPDNVAEFLHCRCALLQCRIFLSGQLDLDNLFQPRRTQLARHADVEAIDAVFALQKCRAGKDLFLVLQNRFGHFDRCC